MKKLIITIGISIGLLGCKVKKKEQKSEKELKQEVKTEYITKDSLIYQKFTEYVPYFDTITKTLYVYPKSEKVNISQNKATQLKKDSVVVYKTKEKIKYVEKPNNTFKWLTLFLVLLGGIILAFLIWFKGNKVLSLFR